MLNVSFDCMLFVIVAWLQHCVVGWVGERDPLRKPLRDRIGISCNHKPLTNLFLSLHNGYRLPSKARRTPRASMCDMNELEMLRLRVAMARVRLNDYDTPDARDELAAADEALLKTLRLRFATAKVRLNDNDTPDARDELAAAEKALLDYESYRDADFGKKDPGADVEGVILDESNVEQLVVLDEAAVRKLEKESQDRMKVMDAQKLLDAEFTLANLTLLEDPAVPWRKISRSLSELHYQAIGGSERAESILLEQLVKHNGTWVADSADELIRKAWTMSSNLNHNMLLSEGKSMLSKGDGFGALCIFNRLCEEVAPEWAEGWHWRGLCFYNALRLYDEAEQSFEKALSLNPRRYPTMVALAKVLQDERNETRDNLNANVRLGRSRYAEAVGNGTGTLPEERNGIAAAEIVERRQARAQELFDEIERIFPSGDYTRWGGMFR